LLGRSMFAEKPTRSPLFNLAFAWTALLQVLAGFVAFRVFDMGFLSFCVSVLLGWIPITVVEVKRRTGPTPGDMILLALWYPLVFAGMALFSHWYFRGQL